MRLVDTHTVKPLSARIAAMEQRVSPRGPELCARCGDPKDLRLPDVVERRYTVSWSNEPSDGPECCPGCGRRRVFHIEFDKGG